MKSNLILANRALPMDYGADEMPKRIHIVPRGELFNKAANITQVLDDTALNSILADLNDVKAKNGGLYLGEEHFIYNSEARSEAFAWAKKFELDAQGIWAVDPEYTDVGAPAIKNRRYKWTSFVADAEIPGAVQKLANNKVRILKIDTVGFTNYANGKSLLTPITNREKDFADVSASAASNQQQQNERTITMKSIAQKLGLAAEASEDAILAEVTKLQNRNTTLEPLDAENTTLKNRIKEIDAEAVATMLDAHGVKDEKIVNRLKPVLLALKNREERVAALTDFGFKPVETKAPVAGKSQLHLNRQDGGNGNAGAANESELIQQGETLIQEYKLKNRCSYQDARNAIRSVPANAKYFGLAK